jgi:protein-tyrosine-phosphatase
LGVSHLAEVGLRTASAGTHAIAGNTASREMKKVAAEIDLDLGGHRSAPLEVATARGAALVYVMEAPQAAWLLHQTGTTGLLLGKGGIDDPYGHGLDVYRRVRDEILGAIRIRLPDMIDLATLT